MDRFGAHPGNEHVAVLILRFPELRFRQKLALLERSISGISDDVVLVIDDPLQLPARHIEHEADARRHALVKPDVRNGHRKINMAHSLPTHPAERHFDTAPVANHALVLNPLVFSAGAFPVARRSKNALAKQASLFRLECPIVDRLGILDFALTPAADAVGGGNGDGHLVKPDRPLLSKNFANIDFFHRNSDGRCACSARLSCRLGKDGLFSADANVEAKSLHFLDEDVE